MNESFGQYLRRLRLERNLSQRELARMSGLNHSEISRLEGGSRPTPSPDSLAKLGPHLGVTQEHLMRRLGYLASNSPAGLDGAIASLLNENVAVRSLVLQLTGRRLSQAGREYLAYALMAAGEELKRLEQEAE